MVPHLSTVAVIVNVITAISKACFSTITLLAFLNRSNKVLFRSFSWCRIWLSIEMDIPIIHLGLLNISVSTFIAHLWHGRIPWRDFRTLRAHGHGGCSHRSSRHTLSNKSPRVGRVWVCMWTKKSCCLPVESRIKCWWQRWGWGRCWGWSALVCEVHNRIKTSHAKSRPWRLDLWYAGWLWHW